jgi:hypothetical protein
MVVRWEGWGLGMGDGEFKAYTLVQCEEEETHWYEIRFIGMETQRLRLTPKAQKPNNAPWAEFPARIARQNQV